MHPGHATRLSELVFPASMLGSLGCEMLQICPHKTLLRVFLRGGSKLQKLPGRAILPLQLSSLARSVSFQSGFYRKANTKHEIP
jgi:hypothetical protein